MGRRPSPTARRPGVGQRGQHAARRADVEGASRRRVGTPIRRGGPAGRTGGAPQRIDAFLLHYPACFGVALRDAAGGPSARVVARAHGAVRPGPDPRAGRLATPHAVAADASCSSRRASGRTSCRAGWTRSTRHYARSAASAPPTASSSRRTRSPSGTQHPAAPAAPTRCSSTRRSPRSPRRWGARRRRWCCAGRCSAGAAVSTRSTKPRHIAANRALHDFALTEAQLQAVDALDGQDPVAVLGRAAAAPVRRRERRLRRVGRGRRVRGQRCVHAGELPRQLQRVRGEGGAVESGDFRRIRAAIFGHACLQRRARHDSAADFSRSL